jgi:excisionase family DNA binding protein
MDPIDTDIMTPMEVAKALRMPHTTVLYHLRKGNIPGKQIGNRWLVLRETVDKIKDEARGK